MTTSSILKETCEKLLTRIGKKGEGWIEGVYQILRRTGPSERKATLLGSLNFLWKGPRGVGEKRTGVLTWGFEAVSFRTTSGGGGFGEGKAQGPGR